MYREQYFDVEGGWWYETEVPSRVKDATCEQALFLLSLTEYERDRNRQHVLGVLDSRVGSATESALPDLVKNARKRSLLSPDARELMLPYLIGAVNIT